MIISLVAGILVKYVHGKPILSVILTWLSRQGPLPAPSPATLDPVVPSQREAPFVDMIRRVFREELRHVQSPAPPAP